MTLCLPAPYGWNCQGAVHLQLQAVGPFRRDLVQALLENFSCYPPAIPMILSVLEAGGRYDCYLQRTWVKRQWRDAMEQFAAANIRFHLDHERVAWEERPITWAATA